MAIIAAKGNIIGIRFPRQVLKEYILIQKQIVVNRKLFLQERKEIQKFLQGKVTRKQTADKTVILVIGESATSERMHCYGYTEKNTPFFSYKHSTLYGKLVLMEQCYALDNFTSFVIPKMLSNQNHINSSGKNILIYDICKYFNIKTYMISNQVGMDLGRENLETAADHVFFPYQNHSNIHFLDDFTPPDEIILPTFRNIIKKLPPQVCNLIIIHLFGSHTPFSKRLPSGYRTNLTRGNLSKEEFEYLKTIEYTDRLLFRLVQISEKTLKTPFVVCYISDHGEDATRKVSRSSQDLRNNISAFFNIPCAFYFSNSFCKLYPGKIHCLKENQKKPFINEYIFDALINLFDIETDDKQITVPDKNVFSPEYKQDIKDLRILRRTYPLQSILSK